MPGSSEKNVFILLTPHSILNAGELIYKLQLPPESSYFYFLTEHRESLRQIENILESPVWSVAGQGKIKQAGIRFLFGSKGRKIGKSRIGELFYLVRNFVLIIFLGIRISGINRLVVANILNPWMKFLVSTSKAGEIIILDDGNATIPILHENFSIDEQFRIPPQLKTRKNFLLFSLQNYPVRNNRIKFFTVFDRWNENHSLIKISNDLSWLKQFSGSVKRIPEIMFIGSPLVKFGLITGEVFSKVLDSLKGIYDGQEIIYIRHRTETEEYTEKFKYISLDKPVELYLLENKILPLTIVSFFSTAGINIHRIFGDQVRVVNVKIPGEYITNPQYADLLSTLSDYYRDQENEFFRTLEIDID